MKMSDVNVNQMKHVNPKKWYKHASVAEVINSPSFIKIKLVCRSYGLSKFEIYEV